MSSDMEKIIRRSIDSVDVAANSKIPDRVWKKCKGIAIINVSEVGFVFSLAEGDGIVMKKNDDGTFGAPSCIKFTGASGGFIFGKAHKQIFLFPMRDNPLKMLTAHNKNQFGAQIGGAAGKYGGMEAAGGAEASDKGISVTYSYVFSDGAFVNVGIQDNFIDTAVETNTGFYGKAVDAGDIVLQPGAVDIPEGKGIEELHAKLKAKMDEVGTDDDE
eukprot:CAMPEP_0197437682 /NCGR_PEP_ID=MMETSP1175-20131217/4866_1 /TAXON_ID=1003142 /ORGANISM="Triceratium dubium, Strain CCMP147" /LENGTH=215 /DNA_ID=CAMNT_0042967263 /DNA_START=40 /DNA_END=687 /DNA_ORIENTATION=+